MVRLLNKDSTKYLAILVRAFFKFQEYFTHIIEVQHPELDSCLYAMWHRNQCAIYGFKDKQRVVIKLGTSTITHEETGSLNLMKIEKLVRVASDLRNKGKDVV